MLPPSITGPGSRRPRSLVAWLVALCALLLTPSPAGAVHVPTRTSSWVARIVRPTVVRAGPGSGRVLFTQSPLGTWGGGEVQLAVTNITTVTGRRWIEVILPSRPNERRGWIRADAAKVGTTPWRVEVALRSRTVRVFRAGRVVRRFRAVIGAPGTPTPLGHFAVYEVIRQPDPKGYIGPWALHLTSHSDVLDSYGGGPGRVAIHGRDGASLRDRLGSARSHGCVRVPDADVRFLASHTGPGTPVNVRP